ncbi:MmcQ/YjbR family DNA-binding protein [Paludicola sp. MB14-C6]|uniref:MmcQ/YjbR family DNA-binding protein n=1 Tax=Paludihabitans sp. MB14-C6 TaxID=3070656 RepID=UPI0027DE2D28|nr:MmcQ/YjbR family DNA-binding protein [Paludicola sp. MB14-C6]WMJ23830.1 MmcQ/YjbR family DNA-binding protein [Paludicola sp. MB14-C6]
MDKTWIDEYCMKKKGVEKDFKVEWQWDRYMINGKLFAAICHDKQGRPIVTVKCEPMFGQMMRTEYEEITAGYYMNKEHWNSILLDQGVPQAVIKEMIDMSYSLIVKSLPKKQQAELI